MNLSIRILGFCFWSLMCILFSSYLILVIDMYSYLVVLVINLNLFSFFFRSCIFGYFRNSTNYTIYMYDITSTFNTGAFPGTSTI